MSDSNVNVKMEQSEHSEPGRQHVERECKRKFVKEEEKEEEEEEDDDDDEWNNTNFRVKREVGSQGESSMFLPQEEDWDTPLKALIASFDHEADWRRQLKFVLRGPANKMHHRVQQDIYLDVLRGAAREAPDAAGGAIRLAVEAAEGRRGGAQPARHWGRQLKSEVFKVLYPNLAVPRRWADAHAPPSRADARMDDSSGQLADLRAELLALLRAEKMDREERHEALHEEVCAARFIAETAQAETAKTQAELACFIQQTTLQEEAMKNEIASLRKENLRLHGELQSRGAAPQSRQKAAQPRASKRRRRPGFEGE